jgi:hypothetical protein
MKQYIGTKKIKGRPMTRGEYNTYRGWTPPEGEDQSTPGYLVEYQDGGKPNHPDHEGYISWSPADVFEKSYRTTDGLNFGLALEALKQGKRVARQGWNGKGMWLAVQPGSLISPEQARGGAAKGRAEEGAEKIIILPHIDMRAADGSIVVGWLASQTDMLSDDWCVLEDPPETNSH